MHRTSIGCLAILLALCHPAATAESRLPELLHQSPPQYPYRGLQRMEEGWVQMSFVVTGEGAVRDALVEDSSAPHFEPEALAAVGRFSYAPALRDGQPVESGTVRFRMSFMLESHPHTVRPPFIRRIAAAQQLIADGNLRAADRALGRIERRGGQNLYEYAHLAWVRALYHDVAGNPGQRLRHLRRALSRNFAGELKLQPEFRAGAFELLYQSLVGHGQLAAAIEAWEWMDGAEETRELAARLADHVSGLRATVSDGGVLRVDGELPDRHPWHHTLVRRSFEFHEVAGSLERLDLRCDYGAQSMQVRANAAWTVPPDWGTCWLYVHGRGGTRFQLFEYND